MADLLDEQQTYLIHGAYFGDCKENGRGFLEAVYRECRQIERIIR